MIKIIVNDKSKEKITHNGYDIIYNDYGVEIRKNGKFISEAASDEEAMKYIDNLDNISYKKLKEKKPLNLYKVFYVRNEDDKTSYIDVKAYSEEQARTYAKKLLGRECYGYPHDVILLEENVIKDSLSSEFNIEKTINEAYKEYLNCVKNSEKGKIEYTDKYYDLLHKLSDFAKMNEREIMMVFNEWENNEVTLKNTETINTKWVLKNTGLRYEVWYDEKLIKKFATKKQAIEWIQDRFPRDKIVEDSKIKDDDESWFEMLLKLALEKHEKEFSSNVGPRIANRVAKKYGINIGYIKNSKEYYYKYTYFISDSRKETIMSDAIKILNIVEDNNEKLVNQRIKDAEWSNEWASLEDLGIDDRDKKAVEAYFKKLASKYGVSYVRTVYGMYPSPIFRGDRKKLEKLILKEYVGESKPDAEEEYEFIEDSIKDTPDLTTKSGKQEKWIQVMLSSLDELGDRHWNWTTRNKVNINNNAITLVATENGVELRSRNGFKKLYTSKEDIQTAIAIHFSDSKSNVNKIILRKKLNEYGEYKIEVFINGIKNEEAAYYTDDWQDALDTYFNMVKQYGLINKNKNNIYMADSLENLNSEIYTYLFSNNIYNKEDLKFAKKYNLKFISKQEEGVELRGNLKDLKNYAHNYLGENINKNLLKKGE